MPSGDVGPILLPYTHKSEIHHREGKMESGGTPSPPLLMIAAMFVVLDHMRPGCSVLMALVFVMLAINKEWVDRWPLSPVIEGQISGRRWRNYGIVRHLEQPRPRGGPMSSSYGAAALDRRVYLQLWGRTPSAEAFRWCRWWSY